MMSKTTGIELIAIERKRQVKKEGWSKSHDAQHIHGELAIAAACYAVEGTDARVINQSEDAWPWDWQSDKRETHDKIRRLTIAGALIAAEIDRELKQSKIANPAPKN